MKEQLSLFALQSSPPNIPSIKSSDLNSIYRCSSGVKIGNKIFAKDDEVELIGTTEDFFKIEIVQIKCVDGQLVTGSKKLFSTHFYLLQRGE